MSILIQGMEMPKNCSDCQLNYDQMACKVTGTRWWSDTMVLMGFDSDKERLHDCPLIELPPHGRLGDLDELAKHKYENIWTNRLIIDADYLDDAPTVIEAERSET